MTGPPCVKSWPSALAKSPWTVVTRRTATSRGWPTEEGIDVDDIDVPPVQGNLTPTLVSLVARQPLERLAAERASRDPLHAPDIRIGVLLLRIGGRRRRASDPGERRRWSPRKRDFCCSSWPFGVADSAVTTRRVDEPVRPRRRSCRSWYALGQQRPYGGRNLTRGGHGILYSDGRLVSSFVVTVASHRRLGTDRCGRGRAC